MDVLDELLEAVCDDLWGDACFKGHVYDEIESVEYVAQRVVSVLLPLISERIAQAIRIEGMRQRQDEDYGISREELGAFMDAAQVAIDFSEAS